MTVAADAASDPDTEAAFFYVCSEALANAVKYADANRIGITVRRVNGAIEAVISDDGRGGADPTGSGLQGLADRLATLERPAPGGESTRSRHDGDSGSSGLADLRPRFESRHST